MTGADIGAGELGPLSTGKISSGRTFSTADEPADVALADSGYATQDKIKVGSTIAVGNSKNTPSTRTPATRSSACSRSSGRTSG